MTPPELTLWKGCWAWVALILTFVLPDRTAAHKDVCFLHVDEGLICSQPKNDMVVTYSQCCCHYGRGWGPECNTCPPRHSGERTEENGWLLSAPPSTGSKDTLLFRYVQPPVSDAPGDRVWRGTGFHGGVCQLQPRWNHVHHWLWERWFRALALSGCLYYRKHS